MDVFTIVGKILLEGAEQVEGQLKGITGYIEKNKRHATPSQGREREDV
jgi:hypothetical protein